ncbi:MAG: hypothetical protein ACLSHR_14240 [Oscillospiraceae bacterium]
MTTDDLTASIKKSVDGYIAKNLSGKFAKKKSFGFYLDIMNDTLLTALTHMQEEQRVSRFVPSDFEYPVGVKGSVKKFYGHTRYHRMRRGAESKFHGNCRPC